MLAQELTKIEIGQSIMIDGFTIEKKWGNFQECMPEDACSVTSQAGFHANPSCAVLFTDDSESTFSFREDGHRPTSDLYVDVPALHVVLPIGATLLPEAAEAYVPKDPSILVFKAKLYLPKGLLQKAGSFSAAFNQVSQDFTNYTHGNGVCFHVTKDKKTRVTKDALERKLPELVEQALELINT